MKKKSNLINTKDELIKNFSEEQLKIYNYYKSKFLYNDELLPVVKEDKELLFMEKSYEVLKKMFKFEIVCALVILSFVIVFNIMPTATKSEVTYDSATISSETFTAKMN